MKLTKLVVPPQRVQVQGRFRSIHLLRLLAGRRGRSGGRAEIVRRKPRISCQRRGGHVSCSDASIECAGRVSAHLQGVRGDLEGSADAGWREYGCVLRQVELA